MAKYLVIEFDEDDTAEKLKQKIDAATDGGARYRVAGMFKPPVEWCPCPRPKGYHKGEVARGKKYGWFVHLDCRKARKGTHPLTNILPLNELNHRPGASLIMALSSLNIFEVPVKNIK